MEVDIAVSGGILIIIDFDTDGSEGRQREEFVPLKSIRPVYLIESIIGADVFFDYVAPYAKFAGSYTRRGNARRQRFVNVDVD